VVRDSRSTSESKQISRRRERLTQLENALRVAATEVDACVLGAIRERILAPEGVVYAVERALAIVAAELAPAPERLDAERAARLADLDAELETLRRMAERPGRAA
jgi:hypothetical protein